MKRRELIKKLESVGFVFKERGQIIMKDYYMTDLYSSILALLKTALFDVDLKMNKNVMWSDIASELKNQCVSVIPAD